ncbi:MAG TPA: hypothetical protein VIJ85_00115 [Rhizomicrobium sp.]
MNIRKTAVVIAIGFTAIFAGTFSISVAATSKHPSTAKVSHFIPDTGVLNADDLVAIAKLASTASADKFSDDPTVKYIGRNFTTTLSAAELSTDYDKATHNLTVETPTFTDGFTLDRKTTESRYVGRNGFGASAVIVQTRGNIYGIENPGNSFSRKPISFVTTLDGAEAQNLSKALRLRISGTVNKASGVYAINGSVISEHDIITDATVSEPEDIWIKQYFIAVSFTKAEWIDTRTGAVVKTEDFAPDSQTVAP